MDFQKNPGPSVRDRKIKLREEFSEKRKAITPEEKAEMDKEIFRRVTLLPEFISADTVLSYMPLKYEADVTEINRFVLESGKTLALPRCIPGTPIMRFHIIKSFDELEKGSFSIREPSENCPVWEQEAGIKRENVFCILPGMAYDLRGNRLGYGKGYYDRFLSGHDVIKAGISYSRFVVDSLPKGRFDLAVDLIVTEKRVINIR